MGKKEEEFRRRYSCVEEVHSEEVIQDYSKPECLRKYSIGGFMPHLPNTICVSSKPKKDRYEKEQEQQEILKKYNEIYEDNGIELD